LPSLAEAKKLVEECFPSRKALHIRLDHDPDEAGEWIVVEVTIGQDVSGFLEAYNRCVSLWAKSISAESLALIRLSYNLA
jgi:hypothetical protein